MFSQDNTSQCIRLLQKDYDGSIVNAHSRNRSRKYLSDLCRRFIEMRDKKPNSQAAHNLHKRIIEFQDIIQMSIEME